MATHWMQIAFLTIALTITGPVPGIAQSSQPKSDTYTWNGELVSLDTTAKTMTVKSRVAYQEAISELKHFKGGDRVWIVWSGIHDSSDAVRQIQRVGGDQNREARRVGHGDVPTSAFDRG